MATIKDKGKEPIIETTTESTSSVAETEVVQLLTPLYVGDLDERVTPEFLKQLFDLIGYVHSVKICTDQNTGRSLGYAYVNYIDPQDAARALEDLNFIPLYGRQIRVAYSNNDESQRKSGLGNIFVKNLDKEIDNKSFRDKFSQFGTILSSKIATDSFDVSKGYGFVQYSSEESAKKAIEQLNGFWFRGKQIYVGPFLSKLEREMSKKLTNVFVKNLSEDTCDENIHNVFVEYGAITSALVMRNEDGTSKGFGFVNFANANDAARAIESLNGKIFNNKEWFVGMAQKKSERELELIESHKSNLYVKNLDVSIQDDQFIGMFSSFGSITSTKVVRDLKGISSGSGFVAFSSPEEASRALSEMNGKMILGKPLYVAFAQRKGDRRAHLQAQFGQLRPTTMGPTGCFGPGQQTFYAQSPPAIIPPQMVVPRGVGYGYPPAGRVIPIGPLAFTLANASTNDHTTMLGENLYRVEQLEDDMATMMSGMLSQMSRMEVLHLLSSPQAFKSKFAEAMNILRSVSQQQDVTAAEQLASLLLNE